MGARLRKPALALAVALAIALALSYAYAGVYVYYPISLTLSPQSPPVVLLPGSNANQPDIGPNKTIAVNIGQNQTSASITINPTYQVTYYKNITLVKNSDSKTYYVTLRVNTPVSGWPAGSKAKLYIYNSNAPRSLSGWPINNLEPSPGSYLAVLDLTQTSTATFTLNAGSQVEIDVLVYIPEGSTLPSQATADIYLIYSPTSGAPP